MPSNSPLKTENFESKWAIHKKGDVKAGSKTKKRTHTFAILIEGKFKIKFNDTQEEVILSNQGDYVYYDGSKQSHTGEALEDSIILALRWPSKIR